MCFSVLEYMDRLGTFIQIVKLVLFSFTNYILKGLQCTTWWMFGVTAHGRETKEGQHYDSSAQILDVLARHQCSLYASRDNFMLIHKEFASPNVVFQNNVSLYGLNKNEAIFVETSQEESIYNVKYFPILLLTQFSNAVRVIILPIKVFHRLANEIGDPKIPTIIMYHTGRCGSTWIAQIAASIPKAVSVSVIGFFTNVKSMKNEDVISESEASEMLKNAVRIVSHTTNASLCFIKPINHDAVWPFDCLDKMANVHQLFLYREGLKCVKSHMRLNQVLPQSWATSPWKHYFSSYRRKTITDLHLGPWNEQRKLVIMNKTFVENLSSTGFHCLLWAMKCERYIKTQRCGKNIAAVRYEDFLNDPIKSWESIRQFCKLSTDFKLDPKVDYKRMPYSHAAIKVLSKNILKAITLEQFTQEIAGETDFICNVLGVPRLTEMPLLPRTITAE